VVSKPATASSQIVTSNAMTAYQLKDIDSQDIEDLLEKVETSFNIKFASNELGQITTFGQLCDHITNKIHLDNSNDCTSQQAFYKLRDAFSAMLHLDKKVISTDKLLADLLPRQTRRTLTRDLENHLGFKLNILRPPYRVTGFLVIIFFSSIIGLFINWQVGLSGIVASIGGLWVSNQIGNELSLQTIGQLVEKMTRENYLKSRRNPETFNKAEVEKILTDWFSDYFDIDKSKLTKDAKLI
jgi:acyl carrier protein